MLKLKVIACDVLNREISYLSSKSCCQIDAVFLHQGLHDTPDKLKKMVQEEIDKANCGFPYNYCNTVPDYDYIVIGYGLCSNGTSGLSSTKVPLVIPRAHDCITLLLGSKETYNRLFNENPNTYWFSSGWIERGWQPSEKKYNELYAKYIEKYGEDNAEFLMNMEQGWMKEYKNAALITWHSLNNFDFYSDFTKCSADFLGWNYLQFEGDEGLLGRMLNGKFNDNEVLIIPANKKTIPSYDDGIMSFEK